MAQCQICQDAGVYYDKKKDKYVKCKCVIQRELTTYLKYLAKKPHDLKFTTKDYHKYNNDRCFKNVSDAVFNSKLKAFLIRSYFLDHYEWRELTGFQVMETYLGADENYTITDHQEVDFLILRLGIEQPNKAMGNVLLSLVRDRKHKEKLTWIHIAKGTNNAQLKSLYSDEFIDYIFNKDNFIQINTAKK